MDSMAPSFIDFVKSIMLQSHPGNKFGYRFGSLYLAARFRSTPEKADNILEPVISHEQ
jgi:hypothetical protein